MSKGHARQQSCNMAVMQGSSHARQQSCKAACMPGASHCKAAVGNFWRGGFLAWDLNMNSSHSHQIPADSGPAAI
eukprot:353055-Chlamydomonas_euryale.AAC.2